MKSMEARIKELEVELETAINEHNRAFETVNNCKTKINQLQGALSALSEFTEKPDGEAMPTEVVE